MRRPILLVSAVALGMIGFLHPALADEGPAAVFPGFTAVDSHAQGQLATGYLFAVGDELTRVVGAAVEINGPPPGATAIAAYIQKGAGGTYLYGVAGGGGNGKGGALPQPPPGEADAFYPANPQAATWEGPLTGGAKSQVLDGRMTSKVTAIPTARGDAAVTDIVVPGSLEIAKGVVVSHSEPADQGVASESSSVLSGVTIGPLHIDTIVSRAYAFVPADPGPSKGIARTIVEGATVNGTPVQITDQGLVAGSSPSPGPQSQVNDAMAKAGYPQVKLTPSIVKTGEDGSFSATTGVIQVIHRDEKLGAQNPQGFQGGGFSVGGAEVSILASRCAPNCGGALDLSAPPVAPGGQSPAFDAGPPGRGSGSTSSSSSSSSGYGSSSTSAVSPIEPSTSSAGTEPSSSTGPTTPTAPAPESSTAAPPATSQQAPQTAPQTPARPRTLAATQLPPDVAGWMRDAFLAFGAALLILLLSGTLLVRSR
ncbi:MAG TPA: hypothetical protein VF112_03895 [Candidatus Dormibacteraeota bacterium]